MAKKCKKTRSRAPAACDCTSSKHRVHRLSTMREERNRTRKGEEPRCQLDSTKNAVDRSGAIFIENSCQFPPGTDLEENPRVSGEAARATAHV